MGQGVRSSYQQLLLSDASTRAWREGMQQGLAGLYQVVQSRQKRLTQEIQSYEMKRQVFQNRVDLLMALGGGWESPILETVSSLPEKDLLH